MANNDRQNCGVTIHLVDKGIDTGDVIDQMPISPGRTDNFSTYPIHQLGVALPRLKNIIEDILANRVSVHKAEGESRLWYHPTIFEYFYYRIFKGIR